MSAYTSGCSVPFQAVLQELGKNRVRGNALLMSRFGKSGAKPPCEKKSDFLGKMKGISGGGWGLSRRAREISQRGVGDFSAVGEGKTREDAQEKGGWYTIRGGRRDDA